MACSRLLTVIFSLLLAPLFSSNFAFAGDDPRDPWEGLNRKIFEFNDAADRYVLRPVAKGYKEVTPSVVDQSIGNFFNNLEELRNFGNGILQAKPSVAGLAVGRFLINTTIGVLGLFDVAGNIGLERHSEDFGQTLAVWGVESGPYLVIPFFGPSTLRDGVGRGVDGYTSPNRAVDPEAASYALSGLDLLQLRASLLGADELISGDRYTFFKGVYLQRRDFEISDGVFQDSFGGEDFESFDDF
ncbi:VacJ family lipoprotein [Spongiibacter sp. KMU-158]|uniref:VacJ family lipoprotein n=1 Tax=Spongiibacter pelagi TaxID=2760804 RepID=A0A927GW23_9GAMM|nr:VacJ family lipoprotein [Spongiibacter pelagi]MBD2858497.1 VacJ family lipoprotein [Spongiibacter pelagi]